MLHKIIVINNTLWLSLWLSVNGENNVLQIIISVMHLHSADLYSCEFLFVCSTPVHSAGSVTYISKGNFSNVFLLSSHLAVMDEGSFSNLFRETKMFKSVY